MLTFHKLTTFHMIPQYLIIWLLISSKQLLINILFSINQKPNLILSPAFIYYLCCFDNYLASPFIFCATVLSGSKNNIYLINTYITIATPITS